MEMWTGLLFGRDGTPTTRSIKLGRGEECVLAAGA
jgi:hypothetical protein